MKIESDYTVCTTKQRTAQTQTGSVCGKSCHRNNGKNRNGKWEKDISQELTADATSTDVVILDKNRQIVPESSCLPAPGLPLVQSVPWRRR